VVAHYGLVHVYCYWAFDWAWALRCMWAMDWT